MSTYSFYSRCLKLATPIYPASHDLSLSQRLLLYSGFISCSSPGIFALLPNFVRTLDKLSKLVNEKMIGIGAQRAILPTLGSRSIWDISGRWKTKDSQLFLLKDRGQREFCLQPTHEEEVTSLVHSLDLSYKNLPVLIYQIGNKFRDELRPRYGLIRCREFLMKDLYSFDATESDAISTYKKVCATYANLFSELKLPYYKVSADAGPIGGKLSHEFHIPIPIGEDRLHVCTKCGAGYNSEVAEFDRRPDCGNLESEAKTDRCSHSFQEVRGIEVGHCFLLGQRYSKCFGATYSSPGGKILFEMGCYGLGMTRLLAAAVEYLTATAFPDLPTEQITELRWPPGLAPFGAALALQKESAHDAPSADELKLVFDSLSHTRDGNEFIQSVPGDFLVDDRSGLSLGRKLVDLKRLGIPWIVLVKARRHPNSVYELVDVYNAQSYEASLDQVREAFHHPFRFGTHELPRWSQNRPDCKTQQTV